MKQKRYASLELHTLSNMLRRRVDHQHNHDFGDEITRTQSWIMCYLYERHDKDVFQKDIEARFQIRRSTASGILSLMEKKELITRTAVDYDARLKKLSLTPRGISYCQGVKKSIAETEQQILRGFSAAESEQFFSMLNRIRTNLES